MNGYKVVYMVSENGKIVTETGLTYKTLISLLQSPACVVLSATALLTKE